MCVWVLGAVKPCLYLSRERPVHKGRGAPRKWHHANNVTHYSQRECSHCLQATWKVCTNLRANLLARPVWTGPNTGLPNTFKAYPHRARIDSSTNWPNELTDELTLVANEFSPFHTGSHVYTSGAKVSHLPHFLAGIFVQNKYIFTQFQSEFLVWFWFVMMDEGPGPSKPVHSGGKGVKYPWDFDLINQVQLFPMLWDPNDKNWKNEKLKSGNLLR